MRDMPVIPLGRIEVPVLQPFLQLPAPADAVSRQTGPCRTRGVLQTTRRTKLLAGGQIGVEQIAQ